MHRVAHADCDPIVARDVAAQYGLGMDGEVDLVASTRCDHHRCMRLTGLAHGCDRRIAAFVDELGDSRSRPLLLVATNALQAVTLLPLLMVTSERLWPAFVVVGVQALIRQVNDPASFSVVPRLVGDDQLVCVHAVLSSGASLARLVGAPLGGIAVATGGLTAVVVVDAATFAVGGASAWLIRSDAVRRSAVNDGDRADDSDVIDTSVRAGLRIVQESGQLMAMLGVQGVVNLAFGAFNVVFVAFVADYLDGGGTEVGLIRGSAAFGGIVSGLVIARFAQRWDPPLVMVAGYSLFFVVGIAFVNAPSFTTTLWIYIVLFGLTGFPNVTSQGRHQRHAPAARTARRDRPHVGALRSNGRARSRRWFDRYRSAARTDNGQSAVQRSDLLHGRLRHHRLLRCPATATPGCRRPLKRDVRAGLTCGRSREEFLTADHGGGRVTPVS